MFGSSSFNPAAYQVIQHTFVATALMQVARVYFMPVLVGEFSECEFP